MYVRVESLALFPGFDFNVRVHLHKVLVQHSAVQ